MQAYTKCIVHTLWDKHHTQNVSINYVKEITMKYTLIVFIHIVILIGCNFNEKKTGDDDTQNMKNVIDNYIEEIAQTHEIPGLAVAVIKDGQEYYKTYYGFASLENQKSVDEKTIFRIYSTTKLITSTGLFQLIQKGKVSLKDKISSYIEGLPNDWRDVQIENLLTHSSGIPDIIRYDSNLADEEIISEMSSDGMDFETGNQFWYNQSNYWLIAKIIENQTANSFEDYIIKNQFSGDTTHVYFSSNSSLSLPNRANKYEYNGKRKEFEKTVNNDGERAHPGNGLNITLNAFINWNKRFDNDILIDSITKFEMWEPFEFGNGRDKFRYGWGEYSSNGNQSLGFTGGGVSGFRKFPEKNLTIIFLSNGYKYFPIQDMIINHIAGIVDISLINNESLTKEAIISSFLQLSILKAIDEYKNLRKNNPTQNLEGTLNSLGYALMRDGRIKDAIEIFKLNVDENPNSSNAYDSLAEAYFNDKQLEVSLEYYQKSLELNAGNNNAKVMIDVITKQLKNK